MNNSLNISIDFIKQLKQQIVSSRYIVAKIANTESLRLYFVIGKSVDEQFKSEKWGAKVLTAISERLQQELPGLRGFSAINIKKMRVFYQEWSQYDAISSSITTKLKGLENGIWSSATTKLIESKNKQGNLTAFLSIPFTHHYEIILKIKNEKQRWYYIFNKTLTSVLSNKAIRAFKDQYLLDFNKPMGVAVFKTTDTLPKKYRKALPGPEELKRLLD